MPTTPLAPTLDTATAVPCAGAPTGLPALPALYTYLAQVPDHRDPRGVRHPLVAVLAQVCCALLCGARHLTAIAEWGRFHAGELTWALGFTRPQTPACSTLHDLLQGLAWSELETQLRSWVAAVEAQLATDAAATHEEALALDGKTLRGALKLDADVTALVTALGHRLGCTAGAAEVRNGDEIAAVETLLRELVLAGKVVTVDALHTQRDTAQLIVGRKGHYVMTVKGNQPELQAAIQARFTPEAAPAQDRASVWDTDAGHGRIESRWLQTLPVVPEAPLALTTWPGAAQVFVVERQL